MLIEGFEALMETLDVLAGPVDVKAVESARKRETTCLQFDLGEIPPTIAP